ncbi:Rieske 2Fe-2S domain-containing protein [Pseudomonas sp. D(2018)]|uniref:Rieske 2Fe-2S domain-containing protein n=1 Tax=Pseudomonas sp. D(2018) TaxID=2502238 RepID=UPI0010F74450|nr:Rieske 2Fe-2S domain-containing protein [Pseudomonas sp. D(2018)]
MSNDHQSRIRHYPTGWFAVAFSSDVEPGALVPLRYFGRELVLFRTGSGKACVADAYCPHMGAHLGKGGTVQGETIRCPFHGWKFSENGQCIDAPCRELTPKAHLSMWPVIEQNHIILVWHDALNRVPKWQVPLHPEPPVPQFAKRILLSGVRTQVRDVFENIVDFEHFHVVHGTNPVHANKVQVDPLFPHQLSVLASTLGNDSPYDFEMNAMLIGPGHGKAEGAAWGYPEYRAHNTFYATPIDEDTLDIRSVCRLLVDEFDSDALDSLSIVAATACENVRHQLEADIVIWENKRREHGPGSPRYAGTYIADFRKWYETFHPNNAAT